MAHMSSLKANVTMEGSKAMRGLPGTGPSNKLYS